MAVSVIRVSTRSDLNDFLSLAPRIYREDPCWVPSLSREIRRSLDVKQNPYYTDASCALFLARRDEETVSRVVALVNHKYRREDGSMRALFGFFESTEDAQAVRELFRVAGRWCTSRGATAMVGPFHPHHYSELGIQLSGFDMLPSFFQTHHRPYYAPLLLQAGFRRDHTVHTRRNPDIRAFLGKKGRTAAREGGFRARRLDPHDMKNELERIRIVFNDAFSGNPYFLPLSRAEYHFSAASLGFVTRPDLNVIVERGSEPVGVLQCVLDINPLVAPMRSGKPTPWDVARFLAQRRKISRVIVFAVGIRKRWHGSRVHPLLDTALAEIAMGFSELESTWMSPENTLAIQAAERFGMLPDKEFGMYERNAIVGRRNAA